MTMSDIQVIRKGLDYKYVTILRAKIQRQHSLSVECEKLKNPKTYSIKAKYDTSKYMNVVLQKYRSEEALLNELISYTTIADSEQYSNIKSYMNCANFKEKGDFIVKLTNLALKKIEVVKKPKEYDNYCQKIKTNEFIFVLPDLEYLRAIRESIKKVEIFKQDSKREENKEVYEERINILKEERKYVIEQISSFLDRMKQTERYNQIGCNGKWYKDYLLYLGNGYSFDENMTNEEKKKKKKQLHEKYTFVRKCLSILVYTYYNELSE